MVQWASCPLWCRHSEGWWSMRGLEAHATKDPWEPWPYRALSLTLSLPPTLSLSLQPPLSRES
jgi:hypothetical protein